jgi:flagellar L-ring protein precursor FlgH|tara:strand:+ start:5127 stop:5804 length:678 start_codon:yes stop_codon:yes gene_type:complete
MFLYNFSKNIIIGFILVSFGASCSTQIEERASMDFEPIMPSAPKSQKKDKYGSIYSNSQQGLFATDRRASKVGDLLTVALSENFSASKSQSAKSAKNGTTSFDFPRITTADADDTLFDSKLAKSFDGSGSADQNNSLRGEISVTVTKVFSNGNMEILGQKKLTLNNGDEYIRLVGIIRPEDVTNRNIVPSSRIANAKISYTGAGDVADTSKKGWFSKLVDAVTPL